MDSNSSSNIINIKKKLKEDYNFIKNDGNILNALAIELLKENNMEYQKTLDFIDTLSKKDIQNKMNKIMNELETAGEISFLVNETIKKENTRLKEITEIIKKKENYNSELGNDKMSLEKIIKMLEDTLELKKIEISSKIQTEQDKHDSHIKTLKNELIEKESELVDIINTIDNVFQNSYENEYDFPECDYVLTYDKDIYNYGNTNHIHYLDVKKYILILLKEFQHQMKNKD
jgi:signal transduction histidine kinase